MYVVLVLVGHEGLLTLCGTRTPSRHGGRGWNKRDRSSVLRSEGSNDRDRADRPTGESSGFGYLSIRWRRRRRRTS